MTSDNKPRYVCTVDLGCNKRLNHASCVRWFPLISKCGGKIGVV
jgi:hypothetical protein